MAHNGPVADDENAPPPPGDGNPAGIPPPPGHGTSPNSLGFPVPGGQYPPPPGYGPPEGSPGHPPTGWQPPPPGWQPPPPAQGVPVWAWVPPVIGSGRFRAQTFGELLDSTFSVYRRKFLTILAIAALFQLPYVALQSLVEPSPLARLQSLEQHTPATAAAAQQELSKMLGPGLVIFGIALVYYLLLIPLMEAATIQVVSGDYLDRPTNFAAALRGTRRRLWDLAGLVLLEFGVAVVGPLFLILAFAVVGAGALAALLMVAWGGYAVVVLIKMSLGVPALILENLPPVAALRRSWRLTHGWFWRIALLYLVITIVSSVVSTVVAAPVSLLAGAAGSISAISAETLAGGLVNILTSPLTLIALTLVYYDIRIRREAFDIEMLAQSL